MDKVYWKGLEELHNEPEFLRRKNNEFEEHLPIHEVVGKKSASDSQTSRRDFLKFVGFGLGAATIAACEAPVRKTIPYLVKPEEIVPGVPNFYASTFADGHDYCSILVKTREGRPIKIEGNDLSSVTKGKASARVQASVLGLYDSARASRPTANGQPSTWSVIDTDIKSKLSEISSRGGQIRIVSSTIISPSTKAAIAEFTAKFPTTKHIVYDAISHYGITSANLASFGESILPSYHFENAEVIVGLGCDFLSNWILPTQHALQYAQTRKINKTKKSMSRHFQFEGNLTLTGSNADVRVRVKPREMGSTLISLYNQIASKAGQPTLSGAKSSVEDKVKAAANELWAARGKSLVVSGSNDTNEQILVNGINSMLSSYGNTIDLMRHCNLKQGNDAAFVEFATELAAGKISGVIVYNCNPVFTAPDGKTFSDGLKKAELSISLNDRVDETTLMCKYLCPDSHFLESWNDAEPFSNMFSLTQPVIQKLYDTRQAQESLLTWCAAPVTNFHDYIVATWQQNLYGATSGWSMEAFWGKSLQDGVYEIPAVAHEHGAFAGNVNDAAAKIADEKASGEIDIIVYEKTGMGNGSQANNPWLQELPDPISKVCWDNYVCVGPKMAEAKGLRQGNVVELKANGKSEKFPVLIQPGMAENTVAIAMGYGRTASGRASNDVGKNAYPFVRIANGSMAYYTTGAITKTIDDDYTLVTTQTHHTMMGREIVKESDLKSWQKNAKAGNPDLLVNTPDGPQKPIDIDLWATKDQPGHPKPNHHWQMGIDLNSCIGCGACVVACQAENNVAVVGKTEIGNAREMHWIRIDRYYSSNMTKAKAEKEGTGVVQMYGDMEIPTDDNPQVLFQPVMCQHCNHAPCETVCPVAATTHSSEGLNMMAYNRCIGTRYCANNCPYKVRRFNWFNYTENEKFPYTMYDATSRMVLNPDVSVRSRGVMEKCTMCVQRIQDGKLQSKKESRRPADGEIKTACMQTCPTDAITFGDGNNNQSKVTGMFAEERSYWLLEELNVQPSVFYQTKIWNREETAGAAE